MFLLNVQINICMYVCIYIHTYIFHVSCISCLYFMFLLSSRGLNQETSRHAPKRAARKKVDFRLKYFILAAIDSFAPKETT